VFLRIGDWISFVSSVSAAFMVELFGVHWVTKENLVLQRARTVLYKAKNSESILEKAEETLTESEFRVDETAVQLLATKIIHEEHCEKLSLVRVLIVGLCR